MNEFTVTADPASGATDIKFSESIGLTLNTVEAARELWNELGRALDEHKQTAEAKERAEQRAKRLK